MLLRWGERRCIEAEIDPVVAFEALDAVWDPTLTYDELKKLYEDELTNRGVFVGAAPEVGTAEYERLKALPLIKPGEPKPPKPPLEFVCPVCGKPLMRVTSITWRERVPAEEPGEYREVMRTTAVSPAELIFMCAAGRGEELKVLRSDLKRAQEAWREAQAREAAVGFKELARAREETERAGRELDAIMERIREFMEQGKRECPYFGMYFRVVRGKLEGPIPESTILRRVKPLRAPRPRAPVLPVRRMWPFKGGPTPPEVKPGMTDEEIRRMYAERGIELSPEGIKFMRERFRV